jgi:hypothetical protein
VFISYLCDFYEWQHCHLLWPESISMA